MRFRILYLLILASLLGTPVLARHARTTQMCLNMGDQASCALIAPDPWWMRPAGLLSAAALLAAGVIFVQSWTERHREKEMLDSVGVHVREEDLPLEE